MASSDLAELISHIGIGDRKAFRRLYELTSPKLFAVCLRVLRERSEAEDALQEVLTGAELRRTCSGDLYGNLITKVQSHIENLCANAHWLPDGA